MSVVINGTGSISGLSNVGGISSAQSGSIIQTVQGKLSTSFSTTSTSAVDTGLTATITPLFSTSKVLCFVTLNGIRTNNTTYNTYSYLVRNGTNIDGIGISGSFNLYFATVQLNGRVGTVADMILDSPATTSAVTYKIQFSVENGSSTSYLSDQNSQLTPSTIILMEVAQ